ncbi:MAG: pyridoxal phosphate-dependent aminotransferase [Candidatus Scalindua sp. AMX11]|nr:MAG: pyridoxal phosphate-dependent aminotransferase [Candidatus Scalindua sp.]NOG85802.1 pyridoxal phosphate-dependent aminotransferase [Planctomycetota bacterium]RZV97022.1 MAG: pyridoxal phosphate-dependent aminotransferase [Candidatus Scalindua sp. SCAELEC01]TDE66364.1 MAG: pyridoxal phosphate-dependent aminotransferase [Candidatus Scalindua sp. AMX11]GJQ58244.1 MAG: aminotransferase [Candidatus Scalindua sp.]
MRNNIVPVGSHELRYEIREIVAVGNALRKMGLEICWENIGDPIQKGEKIPSWIKDTIKKVIDKDSSFAYSPTKGLEKTREYLANLCNKREGVQVTKEDILFFNGIGDAISKIYNYLRREIRVIGPSPGYSTHSSGEAAHAGEDPIMYTLDPNNNWFPDLEDLRHKVHDNQAISGILIINPNNPVGTVYPKSVMEDIVRIAEEFDLFIICDEIYLNITYNGKVSTPLSEVINNVCGISMRGISKELPWPGARCGWIELYNTEKDQVFKEYINTILNAKMLEVCSTTLPQHLIPLLMRDERYNHYNSERNKIYEKKSQLAYDLLKGINGIIVNKTDGAFYMTVVFKDGVLNNRQRLNIHNKAIASYIEKITKNVALDKRFVYYLLGATGICVVPLTGFSCNLHGFRITLLETDDRQFEWIFTTIAKRIEEYIG